MKTKLILLTLAMTSLTSCNLLLQKPAPMPVNSPLHQAHADFTAKLALP
jgi:hypothetical protein